MIESAISVELPPDVKEDYLHRLLNTKLKLAVYSFNGENEKERWPHEGYVEGDIDLLADVIEHTSLSARRLWEGTNLLEDAVHQSAGLLDGDMNEYARGELGEVLCQEPGEQTARMAMALLANALIFQKCLVRLRPKGVADIAQCITEHGHFLKSDVLDFWRRVLDINYWAIFILASELLKKNCQMIS